MKDFLLLTSNLGSLFGGRTSFTDIWLDTILEAIKRENAKIVVLHFQEAGGKNPKTYGKSLSSLVQELFHRLGCFGYEYCRAFLDLDFDRIEEYTALSSVFLIHKSIADSVEQFNFQSGNYIPLTSNDFGSHGNMLLKTNLLCCDWIRKEKFPHDFWKEIRWSRKGFLHTRWRISNNRVVDLMNIHLFHDDCNLTAIENPSKYRAIRHRALQYTLDSYNKWHKFVGGGKSALFIFGDFNFRLDMPNFVKALTSGVAPRAVPSSDFRSGEFLSVESNGNDGGSSSDGEFLSRSDSSRSNCDGSSSHLDSLVNVDEPSIGHNLKSSGTKAISWEYWQDKPNQAKRRTLKLSRKTFELWNSKELVENFNSYRQFDREMDSYSEHLFELPFNFGPTYPWSEDPQNAEFFMKTRAPAWCDRILMNREAWHALTIKQNGKTDFIYDWLAPNVCVGDHKPVILSFSFADK